MINSLSDKKDTSECPSPSANTSTLAIVNSNMSFGTCILKLLAPISSADTQSDIIDTQNYANTRITALWGSLLKNAME